MKKVFRSCLILGLVLSLVLLSVPAFAADQGNAQNFAPEQILVKFKAGTDKAAKQQIHRRQGGSVIDEIPQIGVQVVKIPAGKVPEKVRAYGLEKAVEFAEPDFVAEAIGIPNDPGFSKQWGMTTIQAPQAWDVTTGNPNIKIAIVDTGVDRDHEDLASKIVAEVNFSSSSTVDDKYGHGTHVAGIAAAITGNNKGVAGVGYNCSIMNVKVLGDTGSGSYSGVAKGIIWAADNGAKVINMSLGGTLASSTCENAVNYAWGKGVVVVAAAGNYGSTRAMYPAYYANCIAVAATDESDKRASFSNYGSWVDVAAPGVDIYSTLPNHGSNLGQNYGYLNGTSMATPHVAGLAGLVWATTYGTSNTNVRNRIESTADKIAGTGNYWHYGRVNAYEAVKGAGTEPPPDTPDTAGPATSDVAADPNPTAGATSVTLIATISDVTTGGSSVAAAEYFIDSVGAVGSGTVMSPSDGAFNSPTEGVTATVEVSSLSAGSHTLYVHGQDAEGNWGGTSSTQLNVTEAPTGNTDMYVWSIDFRVTGSGSRQQLYIDITVRWDSNNNGEADSADAAVAGATVGINLINQTNSDEWTGTGALTDSSGVASYYLRKPRAGTYVATVTSLTHSTYTWNGVLDKEKSDSYTLNGNSGRGKGALQPDNK